MKIKVVHFFIYFTILFIVSGCASTNTYMSGADKKSIHTISINKINSGFQNMEYMDADMRGIQMISPILGTIIAEEKIGKKHIQQIKELAEKNHISIDTIVFNQFTDQLNHKTAFKVVNSKNTDAQLNIIIENYGLETSNAFVKELSPALSLRAIITKNGKEIWSSRDYVTAFARGTPTYTLAQIRQNPQYLYQMWNAAAEKLVNDMIKTI